MSAETVAARFGSEPPRVVYQLDTDRLRIDVRENSRYRWLMFGNGILQSAMDKSDPARLVLPYTQSMLAPLVFGDAPERILVLGVGGGSFVRYLRAFVPQARIDAVDFSPEVVDVAQRHFEMPAPDPGFTVELADARAAMARRRDVDLVLWDVFDEDGMPAEVSSTELLASGLGALSHRGVLVLNLMPRSDSELAAVLRATREVFSGHVLCTTLADYQNVILLAFRESPGALSVGAVGKRARALEKTYRLPLGRIFRNICSINVCRQGRLVV